MAAPRAQLACSPRFWITRVAVLALAIALGLWLQGRMADYLASLQTLAQHDVIEARARLARVFQGMAVGLFGGTGLLGAYAAALVAPHGQVVGVDPKDARIQLERYLVFATAHKPG